MTTPSLPRLAIVSTHPIQYNAPFFRKIAESGMVELMVYYTLGKGEGALYDPGFKKDIAWDVPLLEGYRYKMLRNTSEKPDTYHHKGVVCPDLIPELEAFAPHAILFYGWHFTAHLKAMRYFKGKIPVWFRGDSTLLDYPYQNVRDVFSGIKKHFGLSSILSIVKSYLRFRLRTFYLKRVYRHIDMALYVGINNKAYYQIHGLKEGQLVLMPHVVNNGFFIEDHDKKEKEALLWRKELGIADDDFVVLFAGKLEPKKNPTLLLKAIVNLNEKTLSQEGKNIQLILLGNGVLEDKLRKMANQKSYIRFLPFQNQSRMPVVYRLGNVFCLPSSGPGETWGLAINEAMCCGRLVIASDKVGGAIDLIHEGENGFIFRNDHLDHLSGKIYQSYNQFNRASGSTIQERVVRNFNLEKNVEILVRQLGKGKKA